MRTTSIESKNLDVIFNVLKEEASKLRCEGYHYGSLVYTTPLKPCVIPFTQWEDAEEGDFGTYRDTNSLVVWFEKAIQWLIGGFSIKVAELNEDGGGNYHFASEELWISSTQTTAGNMLLEIWKFAFDPNEEGQAFQTPSKKVALKTYLLEFEPTFK